MIFNFFYTQNCGLSDFASLVYLITDICLSYLRVGEERFQTDEISGGRLRDKTKTGFSLPIGNIRPTNT